MGITKKRIPWNKGLTKETDERVKRNSEAKMGYRHTEKTKQKISKSKMGQIPWMKGKHHTEETRIKMSLSHIGKTRVFSEEHKHKISLALIGNTNQEKHRTEETREKIGIGVSGEKNARYGKPAWNRGLNKYNCPSLKIMAEKSRKYRLTQKFKKKDTKIEIAIQKELDKREKSYEKHVSVCDICIPDIVFPKKKIAVFADGDYWHSKEFKNGKVWKRDRNQDKILKENGWIGLRFWGHEIREDVSRCVDEIETVLGEI